MILASIFSLAACGGGGNGDSYAATGAVVATANTVIGNRVSVTANASGITEIVVSDAASATASAVLTVN